MNDAIIISNLNDFIFCPVSIYFHNLYGDRSTITYQSSSQLNGNNAHKSVDKGNYSSKQNILTAIDVYSEKYNLVGKIDIYDGENKVLTERKRQIKKVYDGYVFQIYAQYFAMCEMGYEIKKLRFYSMVDNRTYGIKLPHEDLDMFRRFEDTIMGIRQFSLEDFQQENIEKCRNCIYEPACDRGLI
ncbi:MAG: type V CRISPR-associated protein Cas4 [Bacteroidales bacterium]|nr:type V CRISPR-associated protein Cas4 [Clostridium sp.]MCM1202786.1 type V CRISPR-associated protein Cas4 [Bacteroidales bacterium]